MDSCENILVLTLYNTQQDIFIIFIIFFSCQSRWQWQM